MLVVGFFRVFFRRIFGVFFLIFLGLGFEYFGGFFLSITWFFSMVRPFQT
jgi:hypothetical protein